MTKFRAIIPIITLIIGLKIGYLVGVKQTKDAMPSCLYLRRPQHNDVKPWGFDGKEGIDWYCDEIAGGGLYVSLQKWKN